MSVLSNHINELKAGEAFTKQSEVFDQLYGQDEVIGYKRERVRLEIMRHLKNGDCLLELNCGTGEDALFFSQKGYSVHATDISEGMFKVLHQKAGQLPANCKLTIEKCSFTELSALKNKGPYHYIYSNFGGLNCTGELGKVLESFPALLYPGGIVTMVIISRFCLWESLLIFRGKFRTAVRRFFSSGGRKANVEGKSFTCWYYSPADVKKLMEGNFEIITLQGLCTIVPPSYIEGFSVKWPRLFRFLKKMENKFKASWPWRNMGDYFIITLKKK